MIVWTPAASRDFEGVREYLELNHPTRAAGIAARILAATDTLDQFPRLGRPGRRAGSRELVIARTPYLVVYRIDGDIVFILKVLHGAQRWPAE